MIKHQDAFDFLAGIKTESIDLIFTDPPYWTLNKWRNVGTTTRLGGNKDKEKQTGWFETIDENELFQVMCELYRVLKKDKHCLIMCDGQTLKWVLGYAEEAGFNYCKPLVWDKVYQGMGYHFRSRHEFIVLLDKGKNQKPKDLGLPDIIKIPMVKGGYPTEKPVGLAEFFIKQYTSSFSERVLDCFAGSGSTAIAAAKHNRFFYGCDIDKEAVDLANSRLRSFQDNLPF